MLMKMRSRMQNQKGFTLVELMVVVVILGILVAIAVPIYRNVQTNAEENACAANIRTIEGVLEVYKADQETTEYPDTLDTLAPNYIKAVPTCPVNNTAYTYTPAEDNLTYTLSCTKHQ